MSGKLIKTINLQSAHHESQLVTTWKGDDNTGCPVPGGIYFIKPDTDNNSDIRKVVLIR